MLPTGQITKFEPVSTAKLVFLIFIRLHKADEIAWWLGAGYRVNISGQIYSVKLLPSQERGSYGCVCICE